WSALSTGMSGGGSTSVQAFAVFDDGDGPALYAGGDFTSAGGIASRAVAEWNGTTWSSLHGGVSSASFTFVAALAACDDGSGSGLYAAGRFTDAGAIGARNIARWNGSTWSAL